MIPRATRWLAVVALAVALTSLVARADVVTLAGDPFGGSFGNALGTSLGTGGSGMHLVLPTAYVVGSPLFRVLDTLSLLSLGQHVAVWCAALLAWGAWWARRRVGVMRALGVLATMAAITFVLYAAATLMPRPMARLVVDDPDLVRVDFHSHTSASPDVPRWFDVAASRAWHRAGGFDVAYVSDHRTWRGAQVARAGNPLRAGDGTVLLDALEGYVRHLHVVFLGLTADDSTLVVREQLHAPVMHDGRVPVTIATIPGPLLETVDADARDRPPYVRALEIVDGAPKGLWQGDRQRDALRARAKALGIAPVAGSNQHGWSYTVGAWNLVRVRGWRALPPDTLGVRIESLVARGAESGIGVVARVRPSPGASAIALAATSVVAVWQILVTLHPAERVAWLVWIVTVGCLTIVARMRRVANAPRLDNEKRRAPATR